MVELVENVDGGVATFRITGTVQASDYHDVIEPALDAAIEADEDGLLRIIFDLGGPDVPGYTGGALLEDARTGFRHWNRFHRLAVLSDSGTLERLAPVASALVPGAVKVFAADEHDAATEWVCS
jgi:hypothetical protein